MNVTSISDFRKNSRQYFDEVIDNQDILILTRSDGQTVVMMPLAQYNSLTETDYLNSSPANRRHLLESMAQLRAGQLEQHELIEA